MTNTQHNKFFSSNKIILFDMRNPKGSERLNIIQLTERLSEPPMTFVEKIVLNPIGYVKTDAVGDEVKDKSRISQIILSDNLAQSLRGHCWVLSRVCYFLDEPNSRGQTHDSKSSS